MHFLPLQRRSVDDHESRLTLHVHCDITLACAHYKRGSPAGLCSLSSPGLHHGETQHKLFVANHLHARRVQRLRGSPEVLVRCVPRPEDSLG